MQNIEIDKLLEDFDETTENILNIFLPKVSNDFNNINAQVLIKMEESLEDMQEK